MNVPLQGPVCDSHLHIYDPAYPYVADASLRPPPATVADYRQVFAGSGVVRSVIVQPSSYGYDNRCTLAAVQELGLDRTRAVVAVPVDMPLGDLQALHEAGARGVRFNVLRGAALDTGAVGQLAGKIAGRGWHLQLHLDPANLPGLLPWLKQLPVPVVLDHLGRAADESARQVLHEVLSLPHAWVKVSAPYLVDPAGVPTYEALAPLVDMLLQTAPDRCVWGSDWPHPGWKGDLDEQVLREWAWGLIGQRCLVENPARLYGF